jgi:type II pantothenate kinase
MASLSQLADSGHYRACDWDLQADAGGRAYWDDLFRWHLDAVLVPLIQAEYDPAPERVADFRHTYLAAFDDLHAHPERYAPVDILRFTELRRQVSEQYGFDDPFRDVKQRENEAALELLPGVLTELDAAAPPARQDLLAYGLMAGNIFDLGSKATVQRQRDFAAGFRQMRSPQAVRRWLHDDVAAWWRRWGSGPGFGHVLFFVDNAGSDILLGCLPLARWMIEVGARVTLAANTGPALNDITAAELSPLVRRCAPLDPVLSAAVREGRLRVHATGGRLPLLDLTRLDEDFVRATAAADLIILHGMGRAVESNFHARFHCDVVRTAILKDEAVAARVGGKLFDCVFRFEPGPT